MRSRDVVSLFQRRVAEGNQPVYVIGAGVLLSAIQAATAPKLTWILLLISFLLGIGIIGISPVPWQWTGDDRLKAPALRGFLQALMTNGVWLGVLALLYYSEKPPFPNPPPPFIQAHRAQFVMAQLGLWLFPFLVSLILGWVWSEKEATEVRERAANDLMRQAQARALRSQLEPHVLYNALNSLAGLIQEDPLMAEDMVVQLARLYRMLTSRSAVDRVSLSEERQLVEAYLAMEQMRLGDRLRVEWIWSADEENVEVLPLLLQPLVENAIKHGVGPVAEGGEIRITHSVQGRAHVLEVANTGVPPEQSAPRGVGMGNLGARLELWPEAEGSLAFTREGEWTLAAVRWKAKEIA